MPDNMSPAKKAAIVAAVAAVMAEKSRPAMFLRDRRDGGNWNKLAKAVSRRRI